MFAAALEERLRALSVPVRLWSDRARQVAALRLAQTLVDAGELSKNEERAHFLALCEKHPAPIPEAYWTVRPLPDDPEHVRVRGAVVVSARGLAERPADEPLGAVLHNLAASVAAQARVDEAIALYRSALAIREARLGPDSVDAALTCNNLGALLLDAGAVADAVPLLERAAKSLAVRLPAGHPHLARVQGHLERATHLVR